MRPNRLHVLDTRKGTANQILPASGYASVSKRQSGPNTFGSVFNQRFCGVLGYGEYRLTLSRLIENGSLPQGDTFSVSADQDFGDRLGAFFRYAHADDTFRDFRKRIAAGLIVKRPLGFEYDRAGFGAWHGTPTDQSLRTETGVEIYYRAQVSPFLQITPDIQIVFDPANSTRSSEVILGLRLRIEL